MTSLPKINLVCSYRICTGHRLYREDWSVEQNQKVFGRCYNEHGHEYKIDIILSGQISQETGMLINGYDVDEIVKPVIYGQLDHKFLNKDVTFFKTHQPSAEWISYWIYQQIQDKFPKEVDLKKVRVFETQDLYTEYPVD